MQKILVSISRGVFLSIILVFLVGGFYWEVINVMKNRALAKDSGVMVDSGDNQKVVVGEQNQDSANHLKLTEEVAADDARPLIIKGYLEKYKSPLLPYSDLIFSLSKTYGFDYYWIVAIAQQESNLCKKIPDNSYNCWGYGINSAGTLRFENYETALKSFAEYLDREYFKKGRTTAEQIMAKYCPHSNGSWAQGVNQFIAEMEGGEF